VLPPATVPKGSGFKVQGLGFKLWELEVLPPATVLKLLFARDLNPKP
jgi:hypothetical protein